MNREGPASKARFGRSRGSGRNESRSALEVPTLNRAEGHYKAKGDMEPDPGEKTPILDPQDSMQVPRGYRPFLLVILFLSLYLSYLILRPFQDTLILSIVLASLFYPLNVWLARAYRGRKNLAALSIVFIITFAIAIPIFLFVSALVSQGTDSVNQMNEWVKAGNLRKLAEDPRIVGYSEWLQQKFPWIEFPQIDLAHSVLQIGKSIGQSLLSRGASLLGNVASLITQFFIMVFVVFFLVRDGKGMIDQARYFSPLRVEQEDRLLTGIRQVAGSVLLGTFVTAISQGIIGGLGLSLVGIPGLFWGTMMGFSSLIPIVGTSLVWIPSCIYLLLLGYWKSAIFLALWCVVLVGSIDNFLRPFIMRGGSRMSPFYIFLAIIGGVQYFGLIGILYGPLILSFAMIMLYLYGVEYKDELTARGKMLPASDVVE